MGNPFSSNAVILGSRSLSSRSHSCCFSHLSEDLSVCWPPPSTPMKHIGESAAQQRNSLLCVIFLRCYAVLFITSHLQDCRCSGDDPQEATHYRASEGSREEEENCPEKETRNLQTSYFQASGAVH